MASYHAFSRGAAACAVLALLAAAPALQAADAPSHEHHHEHAAEPAAAARQVGNYRLPDAALLRADGSATRLPAALDDGRPVVLNFIYTSCTAVCPILSQTFAEFQRRLGAERAQVHMVSISIDPEEDTPQRLTDYARRFAAGPQWDFYTGTLAASVSVQKAFQAYFGDKMHHRPATFLRAAPGQPWVRLDGFGTPDELLSEYRRLVARNGTAGEAHAHVHAHDHAH